MIIVILNTNVPPMKSDGKYAIRFDHYQFGGARRWYQSADGDVYNAIACLARGTTDPVTKISLYGQDGDSSVLIAYTYTDER